MFKEIEYVFNNKPYVAKVCRQEFGFIRISLYEVVRPHWRIFRTRLVGYTYVLFDEEKHSSVGMLVDSEVRTIYDKECAYRREQEKISEFFAK
jgi:hypothetical protein